MKSKSFARSYKTLVVDDHDISRHYTVAALRESTGTVKQTHCPIEALEVALQWCPDLIILDIHLPEMNGLTLARRIRQGWPVQSPPPRIIVLSGEHCDEEQLKLAGLDIDGVLTKPVSVESLKSAAHPGWNGAVRENHAHGDRELNALFRKELEKRIPQLDRCITGLDMDGATAILHQLIASSAICGEADLETRLRALNHACQDDNDSHDLAAAYCDLVYQVRGYLQGVDPLRESREQARDLSSG